MPNDAMRALLLADVPTWNSWRKEHLDEPVDLDRKDFSRTSLQQVNLWRTRLQKCDFVGADLAGATIGQSEFVGGNLDDASLREVYAQYATLSEITVRRVTATAANFGYTVFRDCDLTGSDFTRVNLRGCHLERCTLAETDLRDAVVCETAFLDVDLRGASNLELCDHRGPSYIDFATLRKAQGELPDAFLKGCGLSDVEICLAELWNPTLTQESIIDVLYKIAELRSVRPIQTLPVFLSYSHADRDFVDALGSLLDEAGVRYWRDIHALTAGRLETQIDRAIHLNPVVVVILSRHSVESDWVEWEVSKARTLERELGRDVLCPVALDDSWQRSKWPAPLRQQVMDYHVLDFSNWREHDTFRAQFERLRAGLGLFYAQ